MDPLRSMRSAGVCVRLSGWAGKTDAAGVCKAVPKEGVQSDDLERNRGGRRDNTTQPAHAEPAVASREQGKGRGGGGGGGRDGSQAAGPARGSVEALCADTGRFGARSSRRWARESGYMKRRSETFFAIEKGCFEAAREAGRKPQQQAEKRAGLLVLVETTAPQVSLSMPVTSSALPASGVAARNAGNQVHCRSGDMG